MIKKTKLVFILCVSLTVSACGLCGQNITTKSIYKDENKAIVTLIKDCGATTVPTGTFYLIPLESLDEIKPESPKIKKKYKLLSQERGVFEFNWISKEDLEVVYNFPVHGGRQGAFDFQASHVDGVNITYRQKVRY